MGVLKCHTSKWDKKATKEIERPVHDNGRAPAGSVLSLELRARSALRKSKTSHSIT